MEKNQLTIEQQNQKHLQAYLDYVQLKLTIIFLHFKSLTGDTGDDLMTEKQYEEFKERLKKNAKNRIYASWRNSKGVDCKMIGPETKCFCNHRYKEHNHLEPKDKKVSCKKQCKCKNFFYIPIYGSQDLKCSCHHSYLDHDVITQKCTNPKCKCQKFTSTWTCTCGEKYNQHVTILETRQERIQQGKAVDDSAPMGVGGLMNFQSLIDQETKNQHFGFDAQKVEQYQQQMIQNDKQQMLTNQDKKMIGGKMQQGGMQKYQGEGAVAKNVASGISALDLFSTPHSFGSQGKAKYLMAGKKRY